MKIFPSLAFWMCTFFAVFAQENHYTVVAEQGDGIFSLLRKQGLDPAKHYKEFLELNAENIKDGSFLRVGVAYKVPVAEDSFKNMGTALVKNGEEEKSIFDSELAHMSLKGDALKDAVYYLVIENQADQSKGFVEDITKNLAAELMVNGARVYILGGSERDSLMSDTQGLTEIQRMGNYIEAINKKFLKNKGKYQRVLVIRATDVNPKGTMDVAVYHYNKSEKGQRFAENIQNVFRKHSVKNKSFKDVNLIFKDKNSLFLARNIIPAISLITMENASKKTAEAKIPVQSDKKLLANLLTSGIMNDYADLVIEE
ncbi:N-acetylmuramoyl-L-alanine amidase [Flagellimonas nanhaiensis]|nr:N-acetylmuramoyl-L-alanine amidase [Allomuricauda nanhaiensis]